MHAILSCRGNRPPTHTNTRRPPVANTQTGLITIHCAAKLSAQCNKGIAVYMAKVQQLGYNMKQFGKNASYKPKNRLYMSQQQIQAYVAYTSTARYTSEYL